MTEVADRDRADSSDVPTGATRLVDHLDHRIVNVLTAFGFLIPIGSYFWLISHYGLNVIYQDQWGDISVIQHAHAPWHDWSALWSQHNENRIFFPNLIAVLLAHTSHFDIRVEEYVSAVMLVGATFLIIWAHKRRAPETPWLYYCPVVILACSFVQYGATLWGFQMAWYLILVAMATVIVVLDRRTLTWGWLAAGVGAAVVASYSSLQGLLVWLVGLALLIWRGRGIGFVAVWMGAAALTAALYLYNFNTSAGTTFPSSLTHHAISPVLFATFAIGDVIGVPIKYGGHNDFVLALGVLIVLLAIVTLAVYGTRRDARSASVVGTSLILFGLLFAALVARGRASLGYWVASSSGYTMYDQLILVGIYLTLLGRPRPALREVRATGAPGLAPGAQTGALVPSALTTVRRAWRTMFVAGVLVVIGLQVGIGVGKGLDGARTIHDAELKAASTEQHIDHATDLAIVNNLDFSSPAGLTRHRARVAKELHLSLYSGPSVGVDRP